jgi:hypothetical protein
MFRNSPRILIAIAILAMAVLSCGTPATPTTAPQQPVAPTTAPQQPVAPTEAPAPTQPPIDEVPTVPGDLANATLTLADLPAGFQEFSEQDLKDMGMDSETLASSFKDTLKKATPQSFKAFMNTDMENFEMVMCFVLAPLTTLEKASFDVYLSDPEGAAKDFGEGAGSSQVEIIQMDKIGDSSVGLTFTSGEGDTKLRADVVISRNKNAVTISMVFYLDGQTPVFTVEQAAKIMNQRVGDAQN